MKTLLTTLLAALLLTCPALADGHGAVGARSSNPSKVSADRSLHWPLGACRAFRMPSVA